MIPEEIRFYFWMGREAKSHCKGARILQWEEFVPLNILSHGEIKIKR